MFVASKSEIIESELPGVTHRAYDGGYIIDFGEDWDGIVPEFNAGYIDTLILPVNTKEIAERAFNQKTDEGDAINLLILPKGITLIGNGAFEGNYFKTIIIESEEVVINPEAFAICSIENIKFTQKRGVIEIEEAAFAEVRPHMEKEVNIYLPDAPAEGPLSIKIVDGGIPQSVDARIYVPASYNENNPNTSLGDGAFSGSGNVIYDGKDPHAPWGANQLNGKDVNV